MFKRHKKIVIVILVIVAGMFAVLIFTPGKRVGQNNGTVEDTKTPSQTGIDKSKYSTSQPGSLWWVVNKNRPLPDSYKPNDLVVPDVSLRLNASAEQMHLQRETATALEALIGDAKKIGHDLYLASGFRSYAYQKQLYDGYVARDGQTAADKYSARPGTSEHQTGMTADVGRTDGKCELEICFGQTPEGRWVAKHAHGYGFIIRYPEGKESVTTYQYEPWHLRYVGKDLAAEINRTGQTMEEFFNL